MRILNCTLLLGLGFFLQAQTPYFAETPLQDSLLRSFNIYSHSNTLFYQGFDKKTGWMEGVFPLIKENFFNLNYRSRPLFFYRTEPVFPYSVALFGNEVGDMLFEELRSSEPSVGNRVPMEWVSIYEPVGKFEVFGALEQIDHYSTAVARYRKTLLKNHGFDPLENALRGGNQPDFSSGIAGIKYHFDALSLMTSYRHSRVWEQDAQTWEQSYSRGELFHLELTTKTWGIATNDQSKQIYEYELKNAFLLAERSVEVFKLWHGHRFQFQLSQIKFKENTSVKPLFLYEWSPVSGQGNAKIALSKSHWALETRLGSDLFFLQNAMGMGNAHSMESNLEIPFWQNHRLGAGWRSGNLGVQPEFFLTQGQIDFREEALEKMQDLWVRSGEVFYNKGLTYGLECLINYPSVFPLRVEFIPQMLLRKTIGVNAEFLPDWKLDLELRRKWQSGLILAYLWRLEEENQSWYRDSEAKSEGFFNSHSVFISQHFPQNSWNYSLQFLHFLGKEMPTAPNGGDHRFRIIAGIHRQF